MQKINQAIKTKYLSFHLVEGNMFNIFQKDSVFNLEGGEGQYFF